MNEQQSIKICIEKHFQCINTINNNTATMELKTAIDHCLRKLDAGEYRIAEPTNNGWIVNTWLKQAILLYFKTQQNQTIDAGYTTFYDKLPLKFQTDTDFKQNNVRVVPHAIARFGSFVGKNTILMPSYINIGAYVDEGCMIDTWATVGSAAQIGKNVHLSGGAGIGGVLEPLQANPTIIEDNCFIGARSEIVEGVIVERNSVISMGVFIGQSTPIYNRLTGTTTYGRVSAGSVVIPGSLPSDCRKYNRNCALVVKQVDEKTRSKVSINELLRAEV